MSVAANLKASLKVSIEGPHRDDLFLLHHVVESACKFGIRDASNMTPDRWLEDGDRVEVGELTFDVLHCPGIRQEALSISIRRSAWRSLATCCLQVRSAAPICREAISDNCSSRSGRSSCLLAKTSASSADMGQPPRSAGKEPPICFFNRQRWLFVDADRQCTNAQRDGILPSRHELPRSCKRLIAVGLTLRALNHDKTVIQSYDGSHCSRS